jgi:hypothetical protein
MNYFIHQTDIFHPHGDPDDHWDLATVYALAAHHSLKLEGIMIDYPPEHRAGDPAVLAVAQMSYLTGITGVPFTIGSRQPMRNRRDTQQDIDNRNTAAARWLCHTLEKSQQQIIINIVGSCTDVAIAGNLRPDLFKSKCKAIYLNAGAAYPDESGELEYNVKLNPYAYAAIFNLPCPIYWCPCWHQVGVEKVGENGTWYSFVQSDVLKELSEPMENFFLYMLKRSSDNRYIRNLSEPVDIEAKEKFGVQTRSMWSTAGILHAAGMNVDVQKGLQSESAVTDPIFNFVPVTVSCRDSGQTIWKTTDRESNRYIFHLCHPELYSMSMMSTLRTLLQKF